MWLFRQDEGVHAQGKLKREHPRIKWLAVREMAELRLLTAPHQAGVESVGSWSGEGTPAP